MLGSSADFGFSGERGPLELLRAAASAASTSNSRSKNHHGSSQEAALVAEILETRQRKRDLAAHHSFAAIPRFHAARPNVCTYESSYQDFDDASRGLALFRSRAASSRLWLESFARHLEDELSVFLDPGPKSSTGGPLRVTLPRIALPPLPGTRAGIGQNSSGHGKGRGGCSGEAPVAEVEEAWRVARSAATVALEANWRRVSVGGERARAIRPPPLLFSLERCRLSSGGPGALAGTAPRSSLARGLIAVSRLVFESAPLLGTSR